MNDIVLRSAGPEDVALLCRLNRPVQALHHAAMPHRYKPASAGTDVAAFFTTTLTAPDNFFVLAFCEDVPAGYVYVERRDHAETPFTYAARSHYVHHLAVEPDFRRHGVGRALMAAVERAARADGADAIQLDFWSFNGGARTFYEALGYTEYNKRYWKLLR